MLTRSRRQTTSSRSGEDDENNHDNVIVVPDGDVEEMDIIPTNNREDAAMSMNNFMEKS